MTGEIRQTCSVTYLDFERWSGLNSENILRKMSCEGLMLHCTYSEYRFDYGSCPRTTKLFHKLDNIMAKLSFYQTVNWSFLL